MDKNGLFAVDKDGNPITSGNHSESDSGPTSEDIEEEEGSEGNNYLEKEYDPAFLYKENDKNKQPSNKPKHEKGKKRKKKDRGGEKGDKKRRPNRKKPKESLFSV